MYDRGYGVSQDYFTAMEYYLKAAGANDTYKANIGLLFLNGQGVSVNKYKALEWYISSDQRPEKVKELNKQGIHLKEDDKSKSSYGFGLYY
jgi:hypothetical protein